MTGTSAPAEVAPWVERLARVGFAAKALLYLTIGVLAAKAGLGRGGRMTDAHGAMRVLYEGSMGELLLILIAVGLTGYALWRFVQAVLDPERRGTSLKGLALRAGYGARAVFHGALGFAAFRLALGDSSGAHEGQTREWTARAFGLPAGEVLVLAAGAGLIAYGVYQLYRAWAQKLGRQLDYWKLPEHAIGIVVAISRFGLAARGVVFCLVGSFILRAAARQDAGQAGGLRESLGTLADLGRWPFLVVAFGLVAYGIYELVNARYRRIRVG